MLATMMYEKNRPKREVLTIKLILYFCFSGRIEVGPRDVANNTVVISRRDVPGKTGKMFGISMDPLTLTGFVKEKLQDVQENLLKIATSFRDR